MKKIVFIIFFCFSFSLFACEETVHVKKTDNLLDEIVFVEITETQLEENEKNIYVTEKIDEIKENIQIRFIGENNIILILKIINYDVIYNTNLTNQLAEYVYKKYIVTEKFKQLLGRNSHLNTRWNCGICSSWSKRLNAIITASTSVQDYSDYISYRNNWHQHVKSYHRPCETCRGTGKIVTGQIVQNGVVVEIIKKKCPTCKGSCYDKGGWYAPVAWPN